MLYGAACAGEPQPAMTPEGFANSIRMSAMRLKNFLLNSAHGRCG
jgi:hypothetical protein